MLRGWHQGAAGEKVPERRRADFVTRPGRQGVKDTCVLPSSGEGVWLVRVAQCWHEQKILLRQPSSESRRLYHSLSD